MTTPAHLHRIMMPCTACGKPEVFHFSPSQKHGFRNGDWCHCLSCKAMYVIRLREGTVMPYIVGPPDADGLTTIFTRSYGTSDSIFTLKVQHNVYVGSEVWEVTVSPLHKHMRHCWTWAYDGDGQLKTRLVSEYRDSEVSLEFTYEKWLHEPDKLAKLTDRCLFQTLYGPVTTEWNPKGKWLPLDMSGPLLWKIPPYLEVWQGVPLVGGSLYSFRVPVQRVFPTEDVWYHVQKEQAA